MRQFDYHLITWGNKIDFQCLIMSTSLAQFCVQETLFLFKFK